MPSHENEHFDAYTPQTEAKHAILNGYLNQYLLALKNFVQYFHYIDGFAGQGEYGGTNPGSPILAIETFQKNGLLNRATVSFVEQRNEYFEGLKSRVSSLPAIKQLRWQPYMEKGSFAEHVDNILAREIYKSRSKVATFAFIDPCGIEGVRMRQVANLLEQDYGEVLLFFNYDGMNRLLGAQSAGKLGSMTPEELLGEKAAADALVRGLAACKEPAKRESLIREALLNAIRKNTKAKYLIPFRFEASSKDRTSHYLVHCSRHHLAFKLMKDVMSAVGREDTDDYGRFEFVTDRERGVQFALFRTEIMAQKDRIIGRLAEGPCEVRLFTEQWVLEPTDLFSAGDYRHMLLDLESDGRLHVYDKMNQNPAPRGSRKTVRGNPVLPPGCWLRAATPTPPAVE